MLESKIQKKILNHLNSIGSWTVKTIQCNKSGVPDIIACVPMSKDDIMKMFDNNDVIGVFVAVEVKSEKGVVSELQLRNIKHIKHNGGLCGIVRSVEDVKKLLSGETS